MRVYPSGLASLTRAFGSRVVHAHDTNNSLTMINIRSHSTTTTNHTIVIVININVLIIASSTSRSSVSTASQRYRSLLTQVSLDCTFWLHRVITLPFCCTYPRRRQSSRSMTTSLSVCGAFRSRTWSSCSRRARVRASCPFAGCRCLWPGWCWGWGWALLASEQQRDARRDLRPCLLNPPFSTLRACPLPVHPPASHTHPTPFQVHCSKFRLLSCVVASAVFSLRAVVCRVCNLLCAVCARYGALLSAVGRFVCLSERQKKNKV